MQTIESFHAAAGQTANAASQEAQANYRANLAAIRELHPGLSDLLSGGLPVLEWVYGRDGSLTALDANDRWWGGCSLPMRAALFMLQKMSISDPVACFLSPTHAAQVRVALGLLEAEQAVITLQPDVRTVQVMLHCHDFSREIASQRLWFVTGSQWEKQLAELLANNPGLPTPAQFIRPILADATLADALIGPAQKVFGEASAARAQQIQQLSTGWRRASRSNKTVCVLAPSRFRLWEDAGTVLAKLVGAAEAAGQVRSRRFDPDRVGLASPLELAKQASDSDALVSANLSRADIPGVVPWEMPWVTWVTKPRIPLAKDAGPNDRLLIADPQWNSIAQAAGWAADRVQVAAWPGTRATEQQESGQGVALIADTSVLSMPERLREYSSHGLLWELIEGELARDPFVLGNDVDQYLDARSKRLQIAEQGFDRQLFIDRLIVPAFQQAVASILISAGVPLRLFGRGWEELAAFASHFAGRIDGREQFEQVVAESRVLVHAWPAEWAHPIDACGKQVVRAFGKTRAEVLRGIRSGLNEANGQEASVAPQLTLARLLSWL